MAFADLIGVIETHARDAGNALTIPITDVVIGPPIPTSARCVRISWGGPTEPEKMGPDDSTLNSVMVGDRIYVTAWWAISTNSTDQYEVTMLEMQAFWAQMFTRLLGDSQLGGNSQDLTLTYQEPDYLNLAGTNYAVLTIPLVSDYTEYTIAP